MAGEKIGARIVIDGATEFQANITSSKKALENFQSELKRLNTTYKNSQNSLEALTQKQQVYTKIQEELKHKKSLLIEMQQKAKKKLDEEKEALESLGEQRKKLTDQLEEAKSTYGNNSKEVKKLEKEIKELNEQYKTQETVVQKVGDKVNTYERDLNNTTIQITELNSELQQNQQYLHEAENSTDGYAASIDECGNRINRAADEVEDASDEVDNYGDEVEDASNKTSVFGDVLKAELLSSAIKEGIKKIADGIKTIATAAVEAGSSFEASMSQVAATMGITTNEIANGSKEYQILSKAAQDCGKATMFSASQAGEALNYLALAGYDAEKAASTLPRVLNLAAAGGLELGYASDLVTDSMAALGMETSELDKYIDQMARTSQKTNTSVAQLGEATLVCAGAVSIADQDLLTMNTELGILANNGIKGAEGGTHLRNIILSLSAPTDKAADAIEGMGLRINKSNGDMRDLNKIMTDMNDIMSDMTRAQKIRLINTIFNKTDIAAVNALLKGTGKEYDELSEKISNCSGAAQDMADTLNDNLNGKITILKSALEGLGITAYGIFDDEMKVAVDSATTAVGRLQDEIDNGNLGVSLDKMSRALAEFVTNAAGAAESALPKLIDGFTWILENSAGIAGLIGGVTSAKVAYTVATKAATVAQQLFNITADANPYILLATAIAGVAGAVTLYTKTASAQADKLSAATRALVDSSQRLNDQSDELIHKSVENRENFEIERQTCIQLAEELDELQHKTELTASEQLRQAAIVDELNAALPELNLNIDEQTGLTNLSTDAILENIDAQMALMETEAAKKDQTEIAEKHYEAEKLLTELMAKKEEATNKLTEAEEKLRQEREQFLGESPETQEEYRGHIADIKALQEQIDETTNTMAELEAAYEEAEVYIADKEAFLKATGNMEELGTAALDAGADISEMSEEAIEAYNKMYGDLSENIHGQMALFEEFSNGVKISKEEILENMQSQLTGVAEWADNLDALADRGINQGLLQYLADMGPQGAGYVAAFVEMTDDQLAEANQMFREALVMPSDTAADIMDSYEKAGENAAKGLELGMESGEEGVLNSVTGLAERSLLELQRGLKERSPSKATQEMGENLDEGLRLGIEGKKERVLAVINQLTTNTIAKTKVGLPPKEFEAIGTQVIEGLRKGIESRRSKVLESIQDLCEKTIQTAQSTLDIHSPSKKFAYLGEMSGEGYISGWQDSMSDVDDVINEGLPDIEGMYESAMEHAREQMNLFEEFASKTKISTEDVLANMESQVTGVSRWADSLNELAERGIERGLLQKLADMGPQGSAYLEAFLEMTDEELQKANQLFEQSGLADSVDKILSTIKDKVTDQISLFEKFNNEQKLSTEDMLSNMESQVTGISKWADNIALISARGIDQGLLQKLADMGPQGAGYVSTFVNMTDEELQRANLLFEQSLALPDSTAEIITNSFAKAGNDAAKGLAEGITLGIDEVEDASKSMSDGALDTVMETLDEHSPSKKTKEMGENFDEGLRLGIEGKQDRVMMVIRQLTTNAIAKTKVGLPPEEFKEIGRRVAEGLQEGIESGKSGVIATIQALCESTIQTAKSTLDIHSPSKKFAYLGEMSGEGYITGWQETMANIDAIIADCMPRASIDMKQSGNGGIAEAVTSAISLQNDRVAAVCTDMLNVMSRYLPEIANMKVVTDTGVLIGALAPELDVVFGELAEEKYRGVG